MATLIGAAAARAADEDLAGLLGRPADVAPSAYLYRADRPAEANRAETTFLFAGAVGHKRDGVICGLLWEEPRPICRVELTWPKDAKAVPPAAEIVVRWIPHGDSSSWWSRRGGAARTADAPKTADDGRTLVYTVNATQPGSAMDNLVVALRDGATAPAEPYAAPTVRAFVPDGWKLMDFEIEWGFQAATEKADFSGRVEIYNGLAGKPAALAGDSGTTVASDGAWQTKPAGPAGGGTGGAEGGRRGVALRVLYLGPTQNTPVWRQQARLQDASRTIVTVRTTAGSFSFLPADLETGPILAPEYGFFVRSTARRQAEAGPAPKRSAAPEPVLMTAKLDAVAGNAAIRGWGSNDTPWFGSNATAEAASAGTLTIPAHSVAMHPGGSKPVAAGWRSPIAGRVSVKARLADGDAKGGNGIEWALTLDAKPGRQILAAGTMENGGTRAIPAEAEKAKLEGLTVEAGDLISLVVAARNGDNGFDTTVVELTVTEAGGKARTWELTKDAAASVQAANPHADSMGGAGVWCFHTPPAPDVPAGPADQPVVMESHATSAREFVKELAARGARTIRQRVREHEEQTWDGAMRALHGDREFPAYPQPQFEPPAKIDVPDRRLVDAWRCGAWHILRVLKKDDKGRIIMRDYPYDALAHESHLIIRLLDLQGMHKEAADGLARWLEPDPTKPIKLDGQFADSLGILSGVEWDWQHLGGPGLMQWTMVEHFLLTADKEWLTAAAPKLKANADWMIRQRRAFLKDVPGRDRAWCRGLLPPHNIWDSTNWRLWYESNANYWVGLRHYADAIARIDPAAGAKYRAEADAYAKDILDAVDRSLTLSPVIRVGDGTYRSFLPPCPYIRGPASRHMPTSFGSPEHTPGLYADAIRGGAHLLHLSGLLPAGDVRAQGVADVLEDRLLSEHHRLPMRTKGYDSAKDWFGSAGWYYQCGIERTANIHLAWDDAPNFLRSFYNHYAVDIVVGPYTFNEHTTRGPDDKSYEESAFLERLRDMLVMEDGQDLWLARATPRAWLTQGQKVAVKDLPTCFGPVSYEIVSDVEHAKIAATVEVPARAPAKTVLLRLRHPKAAPIKAVTVNGQAWKDFDPAKELIRLNEVKGSVKIEAAY